MDFSDFATRDNSRMVGYSPGNKRVSRFFPITTDGRKNAVLCSETDRTARDHLVCSRLTVEVTRKPLTTRNDFVHSFGSKFRSEWVIKVQATSNLSPF